eukprot:GILJ01003408.1.p1 GENE.GILJ01003408.1~~GILJ01003408.1.p1  ORF type:complete len:425 (-),score=56.72 GILJ01003408.1:85-1359(-)
MEGQSHWKERLAFSALGVVGGAAATWLYQRRQNRQASLVLDPHQPVPGKVADTEILSEQFVRNIQFFGEEGQKKVAASLVVIVGLGGVGSHCAFALARSGVEHIRLIDFDRVSLSSLNRHAVATRADVGLSKVETIRRHFLDFVPHANIEAMDQLYDAESADLLLGGNPDFVVDCIDNIDTKIHLLTYCKQHNIRVISSCGAGAKADPTRLHIADISETNDDELARAVRKGLKKHGVTEGVPVIFSSEKSQRKLLPLQRHQEMDPENFRPLPNFRVRIIPVLGTMPAIMGNAIASYVLCHLAEQPFKPLAAEKLNLSTYQRQFQLLGNRERKFGADPSLFQFNVDDVEYVFTDVWKARSAISKSRSSLELTRWDRSKPASISNVILLTSGEAAIHDKKSIDDYDPEFVQKVTATLAEAERHYVY